jgi:type I restriction enzyme M protein
LAHYGQLSETDVREVVLDCKWHPSIGAGVGAELSSLVASLVDRIEELRRRYETTVGSLEAGLAETSERVDSHLAALGVV